MGEWLVVALLGIVEGITEFLPVSSTGHLLIVEQWLPWRESDTFLVVIQAGAALAVVLVFQRRVRELLAGWHTPESRDYLARLALAFGITAAGGLALQRLGFRLPDTATPVAIATLAGGVLFVLVERWLKGRSASTSVTWAVAAAMGLAQLVAAVFPGTSRSGITILVALAMGLARPLAIEFSFLLGVPTLAAAAGLKLVTSLHHPPATGMQWPMLVVGTLVAAATAFATVRWLLHFVQRHTLEGFGWYRIALGAAVLALALW